MGVRLVNMFSYQGRKRLLWATIIAMTLAMAGAIYIALQPVEVDTGVSPKARPAAAQQADVVQARPPSDYAVIYRTDLRQPLFDAPVSTAPAVAPVLPLRLAGVFVETGHSYALFRTLTGDQKMLSVGESFEGVEVTAIDATSASVKFSGQTITLKKETLAK